MIYRHLNKTALISKRNSAVQVVLFGAPGLPLQLVSQQIQDEYIDCKKRSIRMAISLDTLETSRSINDTTAIFCDGFPFGLLPTIRHIEIRITWDRLVELSNVGKKIEPWLKRYTDAQLEFQARMTWTPSKGMPSDLLTSFILRTANLSVRNLCRHKRYHIPDWYVVCGECTGGHLPESRIGLFLPR
jgi:hypothetical protein